MARVTDWWRSLWTVRNNNSTDWFEILGSPRSLAGPAVTESNALRVATVTACVRIISTSLAQLPLHVYERVEGGRRRTERQRLDYLLNVEPWEELNAYTLRATLLANALLHGNGYAWARKTPTGDVWQIRHMVPWDVTVFPNAGAGRYVEWQTPIHDPELQGQRVRIPLADVVHIKGVTLDGNEGLSVLGALARDTIGVALAQQEEQARVLANGARPSLVLSHPGDLSADARDNLARSVRAATSGMNRGNVLVLEEGIKAEPWSLSPSDAQLLQSREFSVREIARAFGVPLHLLQDPGSTSYASAEQGAIEFVRHTLAPWARQIEQELTRKCLEGPLYVEHTLDGLLRGTTRERYEAYAVAITNGWLQRNEVRRLENLDPIPGGDEVLLPLNMTTWDGIQAQIEAIRESARVPRAGEPTPTARAMTPEGGA